MTSSTGTSSRLSGGLVLVNTVPAFKAQHCAGLDILLTDAHGEGQHKLLTRNEWGRPKLYKEGGGLGAPLIGVRVPPLTLAAIDGWIARQKWDLSRPEAIRRLVEMALEHSKKGSKHGR